jgi:hypothetical protein
MPLVIFDMLVSGVTWNRVAIPFIGTSDWVEQSAVRFTFADHGIRASETMSSDSISTRTHAQ